MKIVSLSLTVMLAVFWAAAPGQDRDRGINSNDASRQNKPRELPSKLPPKRRERAAHVIRVIRARPGDLVADIGCGTGWLSEAVAGEVAPDGLVYAVEIQKRLVDQLTAKGIPNLAPVLSDPDNVALPADIIDTAFLHDVADHVSKSDRPKLYASIARALKARGRLVVFDPHGKAERHLRELRSFGFVPENGVELADLSSSELDEQLEDGIRFRYDVSLGASNVDADPSKKRRCR